MSGHEVYTMGDFGAFDSDDLHMAGLEDGIIDAFLAIDQPSATTLTQAAAQTNDPLLRLATGEPIETTGGTKPDAPSGIGVPSPTASPSLVSTGGNGPPATPSSAGAVTAAVDTFTDITKKASGLLDGDVFGVPKKLVVGVGLAAIALVVISKMKKKGGAKARRRKG